MPPLFELIQQGSSQLWLLMPTAIALGALHGLEPGHSKTLMASFIIAIRGSIPQAILLGLCAALSHSLVVWLLAAAALHFGNQLLVAQVEPYLLLLSGSMVLVIAGWMFRRTRLDNLAATAWQHPPHGGKLIDTGHGMVELLIQQENGAHFRLYCYSPQMRAQTPQRTARYQLHVRRDDGREERHSLQVHGDYLQSTASIAAPHQFDIKLEIEYGDHCHAFAVRIGPPPSQRYRQSAAGSANARPAPVRARGPAAVPAYQDAHEQAHADAIARRFAGKTVSTAQIALFGLSGGLLPCPASVTIFLLCLQLKRLTLGMTMVACFSLGLAISLVSVGVIAAWGAQRMGAGLGRLNGLARRLPYLSSLLMLLLALVMLVQAGLQLRP